LKFGSSSPTSPLVGGILIAIAVIVLGLHLAGLF
jgi:hypothetical protein